MSLPPPRLFNPKADHHLLAQLAQIQADCITHDKQLATFLPPLSHVRMVVYWREISSDVEKGHTAVIMQFAPAEDGEKEGELMGYVCLEMPSTETGPFRGEVTKLMVSPKHRRKGVARRVMEKLEDVGRERGRTMLVSILHR
jgi:GNAT superfamily N-acetyltransferase